MTFLKSIWYEIKKKKKLKASLDFDISVLFCLLTKTTWTQGRFPGGGNGSPFQYSCWDNPMDRGACRATVHGVAKSQTRVCTYLWSSQVRKSEYSKIYWAMSLYTILVGKMENYGRLWGESKWSLGKMNKPFKEWVGDMTAFDEVCLGVVSTFILLPCDESVHPDWWNSRVGDSWQLSFFWWLCL